MLTRRTIGLIAVVILAHGLSEVIRPAAEAESIEPESQVWFTPNAGSTDMLKLFTHPDQWASTRSKIDVFKFYTGHVARVEQSCKGTVKCGPNYLDNFVNVHAFSKLKQWGIDIAIESLYPFPARSRENPSVCATGKRVSDYTSKISMELIKNVQSNGGIVRYLAMDEPVRKWYPQAYGSDKTKQPCMYDTLSELADDVAAYIKQVKSSYPSVLIGQIELYPEVGVKQLKEWIKELEKRDVSLPFLHLDVHQRRIDDYRSWGNNIDVAGDLQELQSFLKARNIDFGVIFTDIRWQVYKPEYYDDKVYYDNTTEWIRFVKSAIGEPDHSIFQSWVTSYTKDTQKVPANLPENGASVFSHTRLLREGLRIIRSKEIQLKIKA